MSVDTHVIAAFDRVLERHMSNEFGHNWRTMCHQAAKIATKALQLLLPQAKIEMRRVELIAQMEGAPGLVHIGWAEDPSILNGKLPMHWAVAVGGGLYDPTFGQLRGARTPLDLPDTSYFYSPTFFKHPINDADGFRWVTQERPSGLLRVGYKMQPAPLPTRADGMLLSDGLAKRHARKIVSQVK